jgi:hypothetical protein
MFGVTADYRNSDGDACSALEVAAQELGCLGREANDFVGGLTIKLEVQLCLGLAIVPI